MKTYTLQDIQNLEPCYPATNHLPLDWTGTLVDMLRVESCPIEDRLWVVTKFLDDKTNRLFAIWCAREALKLVDKPDARSVAACDVAERYAHGNATADELKAAWAAAYAAWAAAYAARAAAYAAAWDVAMDVAMDVAGTAAARAAAEAARAAVDAAAWAAGTAAGSAAGVATAVRDTTRQAQIDKLITMIEELT